jgi:hypothetical protein
VTVVASPIVPVPKPGTQVVFCDATLLHVVTKQGESFGVYLKL